MSIPADRLACSTLTDERLLDLLITEEDRLTREAVDECVRRADRMVGPLSAIVQDEAAWEQDEPLYWRPVHATFILGRIGGPRAVQPLLDALRFAESTDNPWIIEAIPSILASLGAPAVPALRHLAGNRKTAPACA